jgi:hypothetical protein
MGHVSALLRTEILSNLLPGNVSGPVQPISVKVKTYDPFGLNDRRRPEREGRN